MTGKIPKNVNKKQMNSNTKNSSPVSKTGQSFALKSGPVKDASPSGNSPGLTARGVRGSGGAVGGQSKDTAGRTDRVPKGSGDPIRLYNRYGSLDSMDTLDAISLPPKGGGSVSPSPKHTSQ